MPDTLCDMRDKYLYDTTEIRDYVQYLESLRNRIDKVMSEIFEMEDKISVEIQVLNETEQAMIIDRYIHNWSWKRICKEYNYCYTNTGNSAERIVKKALEKI